MGQKIEGLQTEISQNGFVILPDLFSPGEVLNLLEGLTSALRWPSVEKSLIQNRDGKITGARNLLQIYPQIRSCWWKEPLLNLLGIILGPQFGLVRVLYFDKPPGQTWALPWHKDLTIAVENNQLPTQNFCKPTIKATVPHVEAPQSLLEQMITLRIHLDEITEENGPLQVLPGSHRTGKQLVLDGFQPVNICVQPGDGLLMRPLLAHCSHCSHPETTRHRRIIIHLEFAACRELEDGFTWHEFVARPKTELITHNNSSWVVRGPG